MARKSGPKGLMHKSRRGRISAGENKVRTAEEVLRKWAEDDNRPVEGPRVRKNKDRSIDGQIIVGGPWNSLGERLVKMVGTEKGELPIEGLKVGMSLRFEGTSAAEEDPTEHKYRRSRGLPMIQSRFRNAENWADLIAWAREVGENIEDKFWKIVSVSFIVRYEPPNMRRKGKKR